jgi:prepilin-type N-terminal cleavage/methylation domain-containing protein
MLITEAGEGAADMTTRIPGVRRGARALRNGNAGLTLIELLCVVTIIGVLVAICLPRLLGARQTAIDARAKSDLRNAANAEEAYFVAVGEYLPCTDDTCKQQLPDFRLSPGVSITIEADNGSQPSFLGRADAIAAGGVKTYSYNSATGGMIR